MSDDMVRSIREAETVDKAIARAARVVDVHTCPHCGVMSSDDFHMAGCRRLTDPPRIVRDLAGRDAPERWYEGLCFCGLCDGGEPLDDLDNHEPSCPWRRARELYP